MDLDTASSRCRRLRCGERWHGARCAVHGLRFLRLSALCTALRYPRKLICLAPQSLCGSTPVVHGAGVGVVPTHRSWDPGSWESEWCVFTTHMHRVELET